MSSTTVDVWADQVVADRWADVLKSIAEAAHVYELAPWNPLPGETRVEFVAFKTYLDSSDRSLPIVAASMRIELDAIKNWAKHFEWEMRANHFDEWSDRQADDARAHAMQSIARDNARAFAKLPEIVDKAHTLVSATLNAELKTMEECAKQGVDYEPLSLTQSLKLIDAMRGLMSESARFLGTTVNVKLDVGGKVNHTVEQVMPVDIQAFMEGLAESKLIPAEVAKRAAIEAKTTED